MKSSFLMALIAGVMLTQAGCTTQVRSLPMPAEAKVQGKQGVALYFGDQAHASVKTLIETKEVRARIARDPDGQEATCNSALVKALQELRDYANAKHANAVVNVTTRFQRKESSSSTEFMCGSSNNGSTIAIRGDVVVLDTE